MTDHNIPGVDDITGRPIIPSSAIRTPSQWTPPKHDTFIPPAERGLGLYQNGNKAREARIPARPDGTKPEIVQLPDSWPGVTLTEVGAIFDRQLDRETWMKFGRWVGAMNMRSKLWVADWVRFGTRDDWGYTYENMADITGLEVETLRSYASIGWSVPVENRILGPKTSFYAAVAPLPYKMQRKVLERVKTEGLSRNDLRRIAKPYKEAAKLAGLNKGNSGRPSASLGDDMVAAAAIVPAQFDGLKFEGSMTGARAFLAELPETARVSIIVLSLEETK